MKTITINNGVAVENGVSHEITTRTKTTKTGGERVRNVFKDSAGFIRTVSDSTTELNINEGIKGFSWLAAVPEDEFTPIYEKMTELFAKYGDTPVSKKSTAQLEKDYAKYARKLEQLQALLKKNK